jgi:hypothetical protein
MIKMRNKRDECLRTLIRAEARYQIAIKAIARSEKRLAKAREEEAQAKAARKQAKEESRRELPEIVV